MLITVTSQWERLHLYPRCLDCLLNPLFRRRSKKTSKLHATGLCEGNSPVTGEFHPQRTSNAENISIGWHHHATRCCWRGFVISAHLPYIIQSIFVGYLDLASKKWVWRFSYESYVIFLHERKIIISCLKIICLLTFRDQFNLVCQWIVIIVSLYIHYIGQWLLIIVTTELCDEGRIVFMTNGFICICVCHQPIHVSWGYPEHICTIFYYYQIASMNL